MELFDVLNNEREPLNYVKERGEVLLDNEYNQGTEIWIINDKKILMTKRSELKFHAGQWEVPGGCSLAGETTTDTIIREAKEEVGLILTEGEFEFLDTQLYKKQFVDIFKTNKKVDISNIELQLEEVSDVKFVSKEEFELMKNNGEIVLSVLQRYEIIKDEIEW